MCVLGYEIEEIKVKRKIHLIQRIRTRMQSQWTIFTAKRPDMKHQQPHASAAEINGFISNNPKQRMWQNAAAI